MSRLSIALVFIISGFAVSESALAADPLLLTPKEEAKLAQYFPSANTDTASLVWQGSPLQIQLPIGKEKRIEFPSTVLPDIKEALTSDQLRLINDDKSLYLTALKPFPTTRLYVTVQDSGEVLLIDLSTNATASSQPVAVRLAQTNTAQSVTTAAINTTDSINNADSTSGFINATPSSSDSDAVTLIRFAWQQLYAPERLLNNALNITRVPMHTDYFVPTLVYGDKVIAHPEISWQYDNTYVTAIILRNKYPVATTINLSRDLCGTWQAATLYPRTHLFPRGDKSGDSTTLFLISDKPFNESLGVCNAA